MKYRFKFMLLNSGKKLLILEYLNDILNLILLGELACHHTSYYYFLQY